MSDYRVELEAYAGPLDLLLHLVKRHEIDLNDIPMSRLTDQYLQHVRLLEAIDVERAGEFLVMAATLVEIKSQMLMPREQGEGEGGEEETDEADPRYELVQQLLAYKRFKDAARELEEQYETWQHRYPVHPVARGAEPGAAEGAGAAEIELEDANVLDLCEAFSRMLDSIGQSSEHQVTVDDTPIALHAEDIHDRLAREGPMTLEAIFAGRSSRSEMIGLFLATLELVRDRRVKVLQDEIGGSIRLEAVSEDQRDRDREAEDRGAEVWRDPETGQMQYMWPDEEGRQRAERRERLREARARGEKVSDEEAFEYGDEA